MDVEGEKAQGNDRVVPEGKGPANQVDYGDGDPEQAHEGNVENVRVVVGLGDVGEEPQKVLQRVPLLADALFKHGRGGLHSTPDGGILGVLVSNDMAVLDQVAGDLVVGSRIQVATSPGLSGEGIDEDGVLQDGGAGQPGATRQTPRPFVRNPAGAAATTATKEELGTCRKEYVSLSWLRR